MAKKMSNDRLLELPYEKIAIAGGEMPKGLSYPDQVLFLELRILYQTYKSGIITRESATMEKADLLRNYAVYQLADKMGQEWVEVIKATEIARANYRKKRTIENADKLLDCIDGRMLKSEE